MFGFFEGGHEAADGFIEAVDALVILTDPLGEGLAAGDGGAIGALRPLIDFLGPVGFGGAGG